MREDPITVLERELVDAARRQANGRARRRHVNLAGLATAALVAVTVAVAAGALILLGGHKRPPVSATVSGRQQLIDILAVLRRPRTTADRAPSIVTRFSSGPFAALAGTPDLPLVRYAATTPWGEHLYFVPIKPPTAKQIAGLARQYSGAVGLLRAREEGLAVYSPRGGGGGRATASDIEARGVLSTEGAGRSFAGGSTKTRLILVVPDGVAKVVFVIPRQASSPSNPGGASYPHSLTVTVPVHDNVAAVQVNRECCTGQPPMIWYDAGGRVIKRIGNFARVNRIVPPPRPGPETPLSRAAERNPSTPNRVWVTPRTGGPYTNFMLHFRVLPSDADYSYRLAGTSCPAIRVNGGSGGGATDLRGRIWSDVIDTAQGGTWCPGTYRLSVTVMDLGRYGLLKHPAHPFGTATFRVR